MAGVLPHMCRDSHRQPPGDEDSARDAEDQRAIFCSALHLCFGRTTTGITGVIAVDAARGVHPLAHDEPNPRVRTKVRSVATLAQPKLTDQAEEAVRGVKNP